MSRRVLIITGIVILLIGFADWLFQSKNISEKELPSKPELAFDANRNGSIEPNRESSTNDVASEMEARKTDEEKALHNPFSGPYPPWRGGRATSLGDPRWAIMHERQKKDLYWQGKMPIEFYGKVVDQSGQPVTGATAVFGWTDLSPSGSSKSRTLSDMNGMFLLRGVKGKRLIVEVSKEGYDRSLQDRFGFEFASFSDEQYYEADPQHPVVFHLRKKGLAEPLIYWQKEPKVAVGTPVTIPIINETQLQFTLNSNVYPTQGRWEAQVVVQNGGLIPAIEEFIVEVPAKGYQSKLILDPKTPKPPTWQLTQGGSFYLQAGQNYGRIDIEMLPGNDWFRIKVWINPKEGSRNIEDDTDRRISPERIKRVGLEKAIEEAKNK